MNNVLFRQENQLLGMAYEKDSKLANNIIRSDIFEMYQDLISRPLWKWKCKIFPKDLKSNLIISDNPVCKVLGIDKATGSLMVPLTKKRILYGGKSEIVEGCRNLSIREVNFCLAAWAERNIYAADKQTLKDIVTDLSGKGLIIGPQDVLDAVRKPLFGLPERAAKNPVPEDIDLGKFWKSLKDSFGPSIFDSGE